MKLNKSTTILLNVVLVLLVVLLFKALATMPKSAYAKMAEKYLFIPTNEPQKALDDSVKNGWKLHSYSYDGSHYSHNFVFER